MNQQAQKRLAGSQLSAEMAARGAGRAMAMGRLRDKGGTKHPQKCHTGLGELLLQLLEKPL